MLEHVASGRHERLHAFSHDLKNRLGGLWEAFLMARDMPPGPERDEVMGMAERSFFGGLRQVEVLMDDMGVPRTPARIEHKPLDLSALVQRCATHIAFLLDKKQQRLELTTAGPLMVSGDAHLLEQLLDALLSNAVKFSPRGSVLRVDVAQADGLAVLRVSDPGAGLSAQDLDRVFERYLILGSRTTDGERQARGTLARARGWAAMHGGSLEAASPGPGKGCTFTVRLPLSA
ncbi:MAG: HAMP domain-containing sensor histidine kinase [Flavobacteriales bacterium]